jgi:biotin transport system substrate-specific component
MKTFAAILTREITISKSAESALKIVLFSFLTFAAAMIRIPLPFTPVPITMQTFVLFMAVYYLNPKELGLSQVIYILAGLVGAPVFAAGLTGMLALVGPTAGYLLGFIVAGVVMAAIKGSIKATPIKMAGIFALGMMIYLSLGTAHLWLVYHMALPQALMAGFVPFVPGDVIKLVVAAGFFKLGTRSK